jgi:hypothetical protein
MALRMESACLPSTVIPAKAGTHASLPTRFL